MESVNVQDGQDSDLHTPSGVMLQCIFGQAHHQIFF